MTWVDVIKSIYQTLEAKGLPDIAFEIGEEHIKGGTPGEMFSFLVAKLIEIKKDRPDVYALIKEETEWMIACAKKYNYL